MQHGESTNWRWRSDAKGPKASSELARDAHEIEEREFSGLGRHGPQLPLPQHEPRCIRVPKHQVILQPAVHLRTRTQSTQHFASPQESEKEKKKKSVQPW